MGQLVTDILALEKACQDESLHTASAPTTLPAIASTPTWMNFYYKQVHVE